MLVGTYKAEYIGKSMCGFQAGYYYSIEISKDLYGYTVTGLMNLIDEEATNACINYASEKSIRRNWVIKEDITKIGS